MTKEGVLQKIFDIEDTVSVLSISGCLNKNGVIQLLTHIAKMVSEIE